VLEAFSATVEALYEAAAGTRSWEDALVALEIMTGSAGAVIDLIPRSDDLNRRTLAGSFSEENCAEYASNYQAICPRIRYAVGHPENRTHYDYLFMTERTMDLDPVYEWFGKHGLRYYIASTVARTPNYHVYLSLQRTRRQGHADAPDIALFDLLEPHIARAVALADQLGTLRSHLRFSWALLDSLPQAAFALDQAGRVVLANCAARHLMSCHDGLKIDRGRLQASLSSEQASLEAIIHNAAGRTPMCSTGWTRISRPSGRLPYAVFVAPLRGKEDDLLRIGAEIIAVVHDPCDRRAPDVQMLKTIYDLTAAEARLASCIGEGHSVETAAAALNMQVATARSHLKSVFAKVGVNRQQDLVRLLTSVSSIGA
jgi:DNA-binding CsgD family transcriptional regulator